MSNEPSKPTGEKVAGADAPAKDGAPLSTKPFGDKAAGADVAAKGGAPLPATGGEQADKPGKASTKGSAGTFNAFIREEVYPDVQAVFSFSPLSLDAIKNDAVVGLDANVLLFPYNTGRTALQAIKSVYTKLATENRLVVPGHAAREFAAHRLEKITKLYEDTLARKEAIKNVEVHASPSLDLLADYETYRTVRSEADAKIGACRESLTSIQHAILDWYHSDPVLSMYREIIKGPVLVDTGKSQDDLRQDSERRNLHKIPPGCSKEDAAKPDGGIGDKLIWHTLLRVAAQRKCHLMFVTQDITKGDWVHYSGHKGSERVLFPKYELTEEYRRASDGKTLHIIELSTLLQLFEADAQVVTAVAKAQEVQQEVAMRQEVIARLDSPQQVLVELFRSILDGTDEELPESIQALHRKIPDSKKMEVANLISNIVAREISKGVPSNEAHEYVANSIWEALLRKK